MICNDESGKMSPKYHLIESEGYYYSIKKSDLLVSKEAPVKIDDSVQFKYGKSTKKGKVFFISGEFII